LPLFYSLISILFARSQLKEDDGAAITESVQTPRYYLSHGTRGNGPASSRATDKHA